MTTQEPQQRSEKADVTHISPSKGWISFNIKELWQHRELIYFLVWRDLKARYKQTVFGIAWIVAQPLIQMAGFTLVFNKLVGISSEGLPYPIFAYSALLPWTYFANSINRSSTSLVGSARLLTRVYFPRMVIPISGVLSGIIDFCISFVILLFLMTLYQIAPTAGVLLLPALLLFAVVTALGVGLWLSALDVRYRDVHFAIPLFLQVWMYATPIIYPLSKVPEGWKWIYSLNPMVSIVEGFRWALFPGYTVPDPEIFLSILIPFVLLVSGMIFFRRQERTFADIV